MEPTKPADHLSIVERINRLRARIYLEQASGIVVTDKEAFLVACREQEISGGMKWPFFISPPGKQGSQSEPFASYLNDPDPDDPFDEVPPQSPPYWQ